jgi:hypothetical protein
MPQILVMMNPKAANMIFSAIYPDLDQALTDAVAQAFEIPGHRDDIAFDIQHLAYTRGEAPVQIEVSYTLGDGVYEKGVVFEPSQVQMETLTRLASENFAQFLANHGIGEIIPSVWVKPEPGSHFCPGKVED